MIIQQNVESAYLKFFRNEIIKYPVSCTLYPSGSKTPSSYLSLLCSFLFNLFLFFLFYSYIFVMLTSVSTALARPSEEMTIGHAKPSSSDPSPLCALGIQALSAP